MNDQQERAAFEAWASRFSTFSLERDSHGHYVSLEQELLWLGFQAGKTKAPEGASGGDLDANARLSLAGINSACIHEFALDHASSIHICAKCGFSEVAARKQARAALAAAPQVPAVPQWRPVSERIPPACHTVLAFCKKVGDRSHRVQELYIGTRPREVVEDYEVTHWMPLPAAPGAPQPAEPARYTFRVDEDGEYEVFAGDRRIGQITLYADALALHHALVKKPAEPAPLTPLTEQQIWDAVGHGVIGGVGLPSKAIAVARAIEAAHGIRAAGVKEPPNAVFNGGQPSDSMSPDASRPSAAKQG